MGSKPKWPPNRANLGLGKRLLGGQKPLETVGDWDLLAVKGEVGLCCASVGLSWASEFQKRNVTPTCFWPPRGGIHEGGGGVSTFWPILGYLFRYVSQACARSARAPSNAPRSILVSLKAPGPNPHLNPAAQSQNGLQTMPTHCRPGTEATWRPNNAGITCLGPEVEAWELIDLQLIQGLPVPKWRHPRRSNDGATVSQVGAKVGQDGPRIGRMGVSTIGIMMIITHPSKSKL